MKNHYSRKYLVNTGVGLQQVDGLKPSAYYLDLTNQYLNNQISVEELSTLISKYYEDKKDYDLNEKEASIVASRISLLISDDSFNFSPIQLNNIHKTLFKDVLDNPGIIRTKNFSKHEWVLNGDSVNYCNFNDIEATLAYDFKQEKEFDYKGLDNNQILDHLASFIANIWQVHMFAEGNTRTIAVFLIKYLRYLGFDITNDVFANHAWYFRNALVRANYCNIKLGIKEDKTYLINFLDNLMFEANHDLRNRYLHINFNFDNNPNLKSNEKLILKELILNNKQTVEELAKKSGYSIRNVKYILDSLKSKKIIKRVNGKKLGYWKVNIYIE